MMSKQYKSERAAFNRIDTCIRNHGVWSCVIRKVDVDVDGKTYYVIGFDPIDELDEMNA
jgi:hypothetical protein